MYTSGQCSPNPGWGGWAAIRENREGARERAKIVMRAVDEDDGPPEGVGGRRVRLELSPSELAFTLCQVPVVYRRSGERRLAVRERGARRELTGVMLDAASSADVFHRTWRVELIEVRTGPAL
jgi:hypothetical protein